MNNDNNQAPFLGKQLPMYPPPLQLLRVMGGTVIGPLPRSGSAGPGTGNVAPTVLYLAATQQLRTDTIASRDREPCLVTDVNNVGLLPGYYLGRLSGSYQPPIAIDPNRGISSPQSYLPVYEVVMFSAGGNSSASYPSGTTPVTLPGLTPEQVQTIGVSLTPTQIYSLNNLTACQLQVLLKIPITNIQALGASMTPTQLANFVGNLTPTQLIGLSASTTPAQDLVLSSAFPGLYAQMVQTLPPPVMTTVAGTLSGTQINSLAGLTAAQIAVVGLLPSQLIIKLTSGLSQVQVATIVGTLNSTQLQTLVNTLTTAQLITLSNTLTPQQTSGLVQTLTAAQIAAVVGVLTKDQLITFTYFTVQPTATSALNSLLGQLTTAQVQTLTNALTPAQIAVLLNSLTVSQIRTLLTNLSIQQLQTLVKYPPPTINTLVGTMSQINLSLFLNLSLTPPSPVLGNQGTFPYVPTVTGTPSSTPASISGYSSIVIDNTNKVWVYIGGQWVGATLNASGSSGGNSANNRQVQFSDGSGGFITLANDIIGASFDIDPGNNRVNISGAGFAVAGVITALNYLVISGVGNYLDYEVGSGSSPLNSVSWSTPTNAYGTSSGTVLGLPDNWLPIMNQGVMGVVPWYKT